MRFTNLCGMTIPERMVALQEMMQELIDAIYAEYRWTAKVSHTSETNIFTSSDIINFDDSDFIVGQTVLFTDGYLGVIVAVDNSVTPKQFTAGYYMQLKGDKGDNGTNGTNGTNGKDGSNGLDALVQTRARSSSNITSPMAIPVEALNRTAVLGEPIVMFATDTSENKTYMLIGTITAVGVPDVNPYTFVSYSSKIDITGKQGQQGIPGKDGAGLVKRYMHSINYYEEGILNVKFNIFLSDDNIYGTLDEFITFFTENHYDNADTSYPVTGFYENEGVIYNIWGMYYSTNGVYYAQYGNNREGVDISTSGSVYDIVVDLGS